MTMTDREVLPISARPLHYNLLIDADLANFKFTGKVDIDVLFETNTSDIWMNADKLDISACSVTVNNQCIKASSISYETKKQETKLSFDSCSFEPNQKATLCLEFSGEISSSLAGFYRSSYKGNDGSTKYMALTQFEATDARKAFPCWDEPNKKATFDITLRTDASLTALSNMNIVSEKSLGQGRKETTFARTPIMSTYLIAYIVGELSYLESHTKSNVPVRIYAPTEMMSQAGFANSFSAKCLDFFNDYFDIPYPLPKMDLVAVPDFSFAAMENWGLVTFQYAYLLFDENSSSLKTKQTIVMVVGHELAHQWFGNLVTMDWWSDLWLNEGFATWIGWLVTDVLFPEWEIWSDFMFEEQLVGLALDSLASSHPIEVPVKNPDEISEIFDAISYSKGASVIRMLEAHLGTEVFKKGLKSYLLKHKYGNASTVDLWNSLSQESGLDVAKLMSHWTQKIGYPLLSVTDMQRHGPKLHCRVYQTRYLSLPPTAAANKTSILPPSQTQSQDLNQNTVWQVPLAVTDQSGHLHLLTKPDMELQLTLPLAETFKLNQGHKCFYRVLYEPDYYVKLQEAIVQGSLSHQELLGLVNDVFAFAQSGHLSTRSALNLVLAIKEETNYMVWRETKRQLDNLTSILFEAPSTIKEQAELFIRNLFSTVTHKLGWERKSAAENDVTDLLRALVLSASALGRDSSVIQECFRRFELFVSGEHAALPPNYQSFVFATVVKFGSTHQYDQVFKIFNDSKAQDQRTVALAALCYAEAAELVQRTLSLMRQDDFLKLHELTTVFSGLSKNPAGRRPLWEFFKTHYDYFHGKCARSLNRLGDIVEYSTASFVTLQDLQDIEAFFSSKNKAGYERTLQQSKEKIMTAHLWLERENWQAMF